MTVPQLPKPGRFTPARLFRPGSVLVMGAATAVGEQVVSNLRAMAFPGRLQLVDSPEAIAALAPAADLGIVAADGPAGGDFLRAFGAAGGRAAAAIGMIPDLGGVARSAGVRVLGPGSFGVVVPAASLNASRAHLPVRPGRLALVSQSAALCRAVLDWAEPNGVGFSHIIGIGGNEDLGFGPTLDWLSRDSGTGAILLDIRRVRDVRRFLSAARAAARLRPVVAIRAGARLLDPTGMAEIAFAAGLRRAGVLMVTRLEDLLGAAETLSRAKPARGEGLAIVTNAIGPAQMAADAALADGVALAELSDATRLVLDQALPPSLRPKVARPDQTETGDIVYAGPDSPIRLAETAALLAGAPEVGGVLAVHAPTGSADAAGMAALTAAAKALRVPLIVCAMGETTGAAHRRQLADAGIPAFAAPEAGVRAFAHLVQDRRNRAAAARLPSSRVLEVAPDREAVAEVFARVRAAGRLALAQDESLEVLAAYGIPVIPTLVAGTPKDAASASRSLGFPVVLKRRRTERSDGRGHGALVLDIVNGDGAARAAAMLMRSGDASVLVQRQVGRTRELLVRVVPDALLGPMIVFGLGGTAAGVFGDLAADLPPLDLPLAHALIGRTRVARTLGALHDLPAADTDAVAGTLVRVSQLVVDFPEIAELDVNPLFAAADGVSAADAWLALRAEGSPGAALALAPYPAEWVEAFDARGERLTIRPIRPEDAEAHAAFFGRLTPEDVRYRFFSALRSLSPQQIVRLTQVDYDREIAFVAVRPGQYGAPDETVGVARLVGEGEGMDAEFAVVVQPDMKGRGVATRLMQLLIAWGKAKAVSAVVGLVLRDNAPMLGFMRHLGFAVAPVPDDPEIMEARLTLASGA